MPLVYISFDRADEDWLSHVITMPKRRFKHLPVVPAEVDDQLFEALSGIDNFYVHRSDFVSYLPILRSLDELADQEQPSLANFSLSPGPLPFAPREPINLSSRILASMGHVVVFAAGNDGPGEGSLSPWSVAPWVIGVGAATRDGEALLSESSIGNPGNHAHHPTVVAPGETVVPLRGGGPSAHGTMVGLVLIGKDQAGRNLPGCSDVAFRGTSVSAPKVSRIGTFIVQILRIFLSVDQYLKSQIERARPSHAPATFVIEKAWAGVVARGRNDNEGFGVFDGLAPASLAPMVEFFTRLSVRGAYPAELHWPGTEATPFPTSVIKQMLTSMARPMPEYGAHQVGAGFVNEALATAYLLRLSATDFLRLLFPPDWRTLADGWQDIDKPLIPAALLTEVITRVSDSSLMPYKVL
jgi:Subtilase family